METLVTSPIPSPSTSASASFGTVKATTSGELVPFGAFANVVMQLQGVSTPNGFNYEFYLVLSGMGVAAGMGAYLVFRKVRRGRLTTSVVSAPSTRSNHVGILGWIQ